MPTSSLALWSASARWIAIALCLTAAPLYLQRSRAPTQSPIPTGCDQFGYLNLAKAIAQGRLLKDHTPRPFDPGLLHFLMDSGLDWGAYAFMIAPHAYHLHPRTGTLVNQYPPGTGALLSWVPAAQRSERFPGLALFLTLVVIIGAVALQTRGRPGWTDVGFIWAVAALALWLPPFRWELSNITSTGPSMGFLVAAGYLLRRRPGWAAFLLGLATLFRVANAVLLPGFWLCRLGWMFYRGRPTLRQVGRELALTTIPFLLGSAPYVAYTRALLGSPLATTYSFLDQQLATFSELVHHLIFYFRPDQFWFVSHVFLAGGLWLWARRSTLHRKWVGCALLIPVVNYGFYLTHQVAIVYYPFASALVLLGIGWGMLTYVPPPRSVRHLSRVVTVLSALAVAVSWPPTPTPTAVLYRQYATSLAEELEEYSVVWAETYSGTVEYLLSRPSFRYGWGVPESRVAVIQYLLKNGYRQVIWTDDLMTHDPPIPARAVLHELNEAGIPFSVRHSTRLGPLILIPN